MSDDILSKIMIFFAGLFVGLSITMKSFSPGFVIYIFMAITALSLRKYYLKNIRKEKS